jgi:hypothetical protein
MYYVLLEFVTFLPGNSTRRFGAEFDLNIPSLFSHGVFKSLWV